MTTWRKRRSRPPANRSGNRAPHGASMSITDWGLLPFGRECYPMSGSPYTWRESTTRGGGQRSSGIGALALTRYGSERERFVDPVPRGGGSHEHGQGRQPQNSIP